MKGRIFVSFFAALLFFTLAVIVFQFILSFDVWKWIASTAGIVGFLAAFVGITASKHSANDK